MSVLSNQIIDPIQLSAEQQRLESRISALENGTLPPLQGTFAGSNRIPECCMSYDFSFTTPQASWEGSLVLNMQLPAIDFTDPNNLKLKAPKVWQLKRSLVYIKCTTTAGSIKYPKSYQKLRNIELEFSDERITNLYKESGIRYYPTQLDPGWFLENFPPLGKPFLVNIVLNRQAGGYPAQLGCLALVNETHGNTSPYPFMSLYHVMTADYTFRLISETWETKKLDPIPPCFVAIP